MYLSTKGLFMGFVLILALAVSGESQSEFIYVNHNSQPNRVSAFRVGGGGSTLVEVAGSPFATGGTGEFLSPGSIVVSGVTHSLYAANVRSGTIGCFSIDPATGSLTTSPGSPVAVTDLGLNNKMLLAVTPNGRFLIVVYKSPRGNDLSEARSYGIDSSGALTLVPGSQRLVSFDVVDIEVSSDSRLLWTSHRLQRAVRAYEISSSGLLTFLPDAGITFDDETTGTAGEIETNCTGDSLYYIEGNSKIHVFDVGSNRALLPAPGSPFLAPNSLLAMLAPNQRLFFVAGTRVEQADDQPLLQISELRVHDARRRGSLSMIPGSPFLIATNSFPADLETNATGSLLYTLTGRSLTVFSVAEDGTLTQALQHSVTGFFVTSKVAAYPARRCGAIFDLCVQDDSNGSVFRINTTTGDYRFDDCTGLIAEGKGSLTRRGCSISLTHTALDRRVLARIDACSRTGMGTIQLLSQGRALSFSDRSSGDLSCHCR